MRKKYSFRRRRWRLPEIHLSRNTHGYFYSTENKILVGTPPGAPEDFIIAMLVHEINHWAHDHCLTIDELRRAHGIHGGEYHLSLVEKTAWWGTDYIREWRPSLNCRAE